MRSKTLTAVALLLAASDAHAGMSQQAISQQAISQQGMSQQAISQQAISQQGMSQQAISQQGMSQQAISQQGFSLQGLSLQGMTLQAMSQQGMSQQGVSVQAISQQGMSQQAISQQGMSQQGMSQQGMSPQGMSQQAISQQGAEFMGLRFDGPRLALSLSNGVMLVGPDLIGFEWDVPITVGDQRSTVRFKIVDVMQDQTINSMASRDNSANLDMELYQVQVYNQTEDTWYNVCGASAHASTPDAYGVFVQGLFDVDGTYHARADSLMFSCPNGTIAKAPRHFGYKLHRRYTAADGSEVAGGPLFVTMVRAAMADYCGTGHSQTRNGTWVDVHDRYGLNIPTPQDEPTFQAAAESVWQFKSIDATTGRAQLGSLLNTRYTDIPQVDGCNPASAVLPASVYGGSYTAFFAQHPEGSFLSYPTVVEPGNLPLIQVDTSMQCAHAPSFGSTTAARPLDALCSPCVAQVCAQRPSCCGYSVGVISSWRDDTVPNPWTLECVDLARQCTAAGGDAGHRDENRAPARVSGQLPTTSAYNFTEDSSDCFALYEVFKDVAYTANADDPSEQLYFTVKSGGLEPLQLTDSVYPAELPANASGQSQRLYGFDDLLAMCVRPRPNMAGAVSLTVTVSDSGTSFAPLTEQVPFYIGAVNDAPVIEDTWISTATFGEDTSSNWLGQQNPLRVRNGGSDESSQVVTGKITRMPVGTLKDATGATLALNHTFTFVAPNATGLYQTHIVNGWTYTPPADFAGTTTYDLTIADSLGAATVYTQQITVAEGNNDPPKRIAPATLASPLVTVTEDSAAYTSLGLSALAFDDGDAGSTQTLTYAITLPPASAGTLVPASSTTAVPPGSITLATLQGLRFRPAANYAGTASFSVAISDGTNVLTQPFSVRVSEVNDAPLRTSGTIPSATIVKGQGTQSLNMSVITYSKGGGADEATQALTFRLLTIPSATTCGRLYRSTTGTQITQAQIDAGVSLDQTQLNALAFAPISGTTTCSQLTWTLTDNGTTNGSAAPLSIATTEARTINVTTAQ